MKRTRRISWGEEHSEFVRQARQLHEEGLFAPGAVIQTIPDPPPPETRFKDNDLTEFLVPESHLSLKLYFDNVRNFGICGALGAAGTWMWNGPGGVLASMPGKTTTAVAVGVWVFAAALFVLNLLQANVLLAEARIALRHLWAARTTIYGGDGKMDVLKVAVHALFWFFIDLSSFVASFMIISAVMVVSVGFSLHTLVAH